MVAVFTSASWMATYISVFHCGGVKGRMLFWGQLAYVFLEFTTVCVAFVRVCGSQSLLNSKLCDACFSRFRMIDCSFLILVILFIDRCGILHTCFSI